MKRDAEIWILVQTEHKRHMETTVASAIKAIGFEPYLPLELDRAKCGRKLKDVARPLFPQYVFARVNPDAWWPISRIHGVKKVHCHELQPVRIPDRQIEAIQRAERAGAYNRRIKPPTERWPKGCRVRIADGPLAGFLAEVTAEGPAERGNIRVKLLLAAINAKVPAVMLERAS